MATANMKQSERQKRVAQIRRNISNLQEVVKDNKKELTDLIKNCNHKDDNGLWKVRGVMFSKCKYVCKICNSNLEFMASLPHKDISTEED